MVINGYSPPNGPVCPSCGSVLKTRAHTRTMGYGGTSKYTENSWVCPENCIITPRTVCTECGSPMIVDEYNVPSECSGCGATEPDDHTTPKPKTEYKMKCKYCGDIQILNKKSFDDILLNGCDRECWECLKRGYEPVIIEEPKDNSLPPCCDCTEDESSCEFERLTCTAQKHYKSSTEVSEKEEGGK